MPAPHPREHRERVVAAYLAGEGSFAELGRRFAVGEASVNRWVNLQRRNGNVAHKKAGGKKPRKMTDEAVQYIVGLVRDEPNWTTSELAAEVSENFGLEVSRHLIGRTLREQGITF